MSYLSLPAIEIGLRHIDAVGIDTIHTRVATLTGWLLDQMQALQHGNGKPVMRIYGPINSEARGGTISFNFHDADGAPVDFRHTERMAFENGISLRTGCFCNPGAGEIAHDIQQEEMAECFRSETPVSYMELYEKLQEIGGKTASTIRVSTGIASNFADVYRFMRFAERFVDMRAADFGEVRPMAMHASLVRDSS